MTKLIPSIIAVISLFMLMFNYSALSEAIAWVLSFTGWAAVAIYQGELRRGTDKTS